MSADARAARSRAAFAERFPQIIDAIAAEPAQSRLVVEDETPVDIITGDQRLYGSDARAYAAQQIEGYMAKPLRFVMELPQAAGLVSEICIDLDVAMKRVLFEASAGEVSRGPISAPTFLVVFGVGLGYQLEELVRQTGARWIIVVEPFVDFIAHSFRAIDWERLLADVEAAGGQLHIISDIDPGRIVAGIMRRIADHGTPYLDGTWVFTHYPLWTFAEASKRLHGAAEFAYINRGFFEDELVMMGNAVANFARHPFWLLDGKPRLHRPEQAVIAGAGPSLDEAIETLHRIRDRVVLFSSGTALRPLLRHGLTPDFHCELENGPQVFEVCSEAAQHGDLKQVRLIASATVDPRVASLFGEAILFFRDSVSSTRIMAGETWPVSGAAPTCVNTALAAGASLGFTDFILMGTDCGARPGMNYHAEGTIYRDLDKWRSQDERSKYPLEVEGNFGGIAVTNWVYDASRRMLMDLIATYRLNVVNCSDGALISGATPRVAEALAVGGAAIDHVRIVAELKRSLRHHAAGSMLRGVDLEGLRLCARALYCDLGAVLDRFPEDSDDFAGVFDAMAKFQRQAGETYRQIEAMPDGSLSALPRIATFYGSRVADAALRRRLFAVFRSEFQQALSAMARRTDELLVELAALVGKTAMATPVA
jgi:hypothetical protein